MLKFTKKYLHITSGRRTFLYNGPNSNKTIETGLRQDYKNFHSTARVFYNVPNLNKSLFDMSEEVKQGFADGKPIVALESTIITHGMPYPKNLETSLAVEQIVRDQGSVPATIAILKGRVTIGLEASLLTRLAQSGDTIKVSRRDLSRALALRLDGGTTVAGTMLLAARAGIHVFVTGGIGGVHRGGETTLDVSADLTELGRTPVCVVSSGVKSILDIGRTLEYLETQGVCVATYGDTTDFPAFYTRRSGFHSPCCVPSPSDAARLLRATLDLQLDSGLLVAVPVPKEFSLEESLIEAAIQEALIDAEKKGVKGKDVTPFILAAVAQITEGKSLETNMALIKNNAKIGSQIAVELYKLGGLEPPSGRGVSYSSDSKNVSRAVVGNSVNFSSVRESGKSVSDGARVDAAGKLASIRPVVIGGRNVDYTIKLCEDLKLDGSTHRSRVSVSEGGVGYNIYCALRALGGQPSLITCPTPATYMALLGPQGDCKAGFGDMEPHAAVTPSLVLENIRALEEAPIIIMDGNLPQDTVDYVLNCAEEMDKPVFFEPTDIRKATKPFQRNHKKMLSFASPNLNELVAMASYLGYKETHVTLDIHSILKLSTCVMSQVENMIITLGDKGVLILRRENENAAYFEQRENKLVYKKPTNDRLQARLYSGQKLQSVMSASGAGDCLAAGVILAALRGEEEPTCLAVGFQAAELALAASEPVPKLFDHSHHCWNSKSNFITLKL